MTQSPEQGSKQQEAPAQQKSAAQLLRAVIQSIPVKGQPETPQQQQQPSSPDTTSSDERR